MTNDKMTTPAQYSFDTEWARLRFALEAPQLPALLWMACDSERSARACIALLRSQQPDIRHYEAYISPDDPALEAALRDKLPPEAWQPQPGGQRQIVHVLGLTAQAHSPEAEKKRDRFWANLNIRREAIFGQLPFTLAIWTDMGMADIASRRAQDFWQWVNYVFHLHAPPEELTHVQAQRPANIPLSEGRSLHLPDRDFAPRIARLQHELQLLKKTPPKNEQRRRQEQAALLRALAEEHYAASDYRAAARTYQKLWETLPDTEPAQGRADAAYNLALSAYFASDNATATLFWDKALALYEATGDEKGKANTLQSLGDLAERVGENAEARSRYDAALPLFEKVGSDLGKANTLLRLGLLALMLGENAEARSRYDAALPLFEKVGSDIGKANTLKSLGDLARMLGENAESRSRYDAALPLYEKVGSDLGKANTLQSLGDLEKNLDNQAAAQAAWAAALLLYQKVSEPMGEGYCHIKLARAAHAAGEAAVAQEHLRLARACSERAGTPHLAGQVEELEGLLAVGEA